MANVKSASVCSYQILCLTALIVWGTMTCPGYAQTDPRNVSISTSETDPNRQENRMSQANDLGVRELIVRLMVASGLVVVLGIAVVMVSKKVLPRLSHLPNKRIRMLETLHIGPRKSVHLLEIGDRQLLIGSTSSQMVKLAELTSVTSTAPEGLPPDEAHGGQV